MSEEKEHMPNLKWKVIVALAILVQLINGCRARLPASPLTNPAAGTLSTASTDGSEAAYTLTVQPVVPTPLSTDCEGKPDMIQQACTNPATGFHYWAYWPPQPSGTSVPPLPLLVYLHGFSHTVFDLNLVLAGGVPAEIEKGRKLPMMVISPQCPGGENWQSARMVERLSQFVDEVVAEYRLDPQRVYLTGFSMGGDGVWALGIAHPEQFAALAPVGSWFDDQSAVCVLKDIPVWVFQGEMDEYVSPRYAQGMVAALKQCGGQVNYTLYPGAGHVESSRLAYEEDQFYPWLMEQKRKSR